MERLEALTGYYTTHDEDTRLVSQHGTVEFLTTVHYVEKYLTPGMRILEIGAGTGRYAHYFARKGYRVDAVELMECNIEVFKANTAPGEAVTIRQGDAVNLEFIPSEQYDVTLLLGPMYHLYTDGEKQAALSEAIRVTKRGGVVFAAYCNSDATVYQFCFVRNGIHDEHYKDLIDRETFALRSTPTEIFSLYRKEDIDTIMARFAVNRLHYVGTDMLTHFIRDTVDGMDEETFGLYIKYHLSICERPDMVGATNHILDIFRKE
ncbi:MAG: methyltransferase domain-containing protein [Clostridia bacterium]|nr:methyltransferase domain-containing protein [Clostridia bacterium]